MGPYIFTNCHYPLQNEKQRDSKHFKLPSLKLLQTILFFCWKCIVGEYCPLSWKLGILNWRVFSVNNRYKPPWKNITLLSLSTFVGMFAALFDKMVWGALSPSHISKALGSASQGHAWDRDSRVALGSTQDKMKKWQTYSVDANQMKNISISTLLYSLFTVSFLFKIRVDSISGSLWWRELLISRHI